MRETDTALPGQSSRPIAPTRSKEEIARLAKEMYERDIRQQVEDNHLGYIVAIDVETGIWAVDREVLEAVDRLRTKRPEAIDVYCERVGYRAVDSFGGGSLRMTE